MKIKKLVANNVHGFLNFNISFNNQLTFLIGINGSGKTTALKLMLGFWGPSFDYINQVLFSDLKILCKSLENNNEIEISAERIGDNSIKINLSQSEEDDITDSMSILSNYSGILLDNLNLQEKADD